MVKKSISRLTGYFFLILFLGFFGSNTFFTHSHIVDGNTIVHSHPFKKDQNGNPTHQHSAKGYLLIHIINNFTALAVASILFAVALLKFLYEISSGCASSFACRLSISPNSLRGPPAWMC
jgi:hypothetical protein